MHLMSRAVVVFLWAVSLVAMGSVIALLTACADSEPSPAGDGESGRSSAESSGIRVTIDEATFSAAETTVFVLIVDSAGADMGDVQVTGDVGEAEGFMPGKITAIGKTEFRQTVLKLPPVLSPGEHAFTIRSVRRLGRNGGPPIEGEWKLTITSP